MESPQKVCYIGVWREDTFSDEILRSIAAHARAEKGKKVKMTLNADGLQIKKERFFKDDIVEFYPLQIIKTVAKNTIFDQCVMFILADAAKKYKIIALRGDKDFDASDIVKCYNQLRKNQPGNKMEWSKRSDTGNWTLRERSIHNADRQLQEIFREQQKANGDINGNQIVTASTTRKQNGILKQTSVTSETSYPYTSIPADKTRTEWQNGHIVATSSSGQAKDPEVQELIEHSQLAERLVTVNGGGRRMSAQKGTVLMPDKPSVMGGRVYTSNRGGTASGRNSMVVSFDTASIRSASRPRYSSLRRISLARVPADGSRKYSTSTTIQRSIEDTYAKPVIIQPQARMRRVSQNSITVLRDNRRHTVQVPEDYTALQVHGNDTGAELF